jgi:amino acid permease
MTFIATFLQRFAQPWLVFLAEDPALRLLQCGMLLVGVVVIFLVFYTTRDILLRTHSFWYMFFSIVLVAALPVVGFFLYLLIRPSRTSKECDTEELLTEILVELRQTKRRAPSDKKGGVVKKSKKNDTSKENLSL